MLKFLGIDLILLCGTCLKFDVIPGLIACVVLSHCGDYHVSCTLFFLCIRINEWFFILILI